MIKKQIKWFSFSSLATNMKYRPATSFVSLQDLTTALIDWLPWITFSVPCIFTASINLVFSCRKTILIIFCEWFLWHNLDTWYLRKTDFLHFTWLIHVVTNSCVFNRYKCTLLVPVRTFHKKPCGTHSPLLAGPLLLRVSVLCYTVLIEISLTSVLSYSSLYMYYCRINENSLRPQKLMLCFLGKLLQLCRHASYYAKCCRINFIVTYTYMY